MSPVIVDVVAPVDHRYVYGDVPPLAVAVAVPLLPPCMVTSVFVKETLTGAEGWVIVMLLTVAEHPPWSVPVTV